MSLLPLVVVATVAVAAEPLSIDLTVHARATVDHGGNVVVRGTLTCSIATTVSLDIDVIEPLNRFDAASGQSSMEVACDPTPTPWTAVVAPTTDRSFRPGFSSVAVRAVGFDPEHGIFAGVESFGSLQLTRAPR